MDWRAARNLLVAAGSAGIGAGVLSVQSNPTAPWQVHAGAAGAGALLYIVGRLQKSPLPAKQ